MGGTLTQSIVHQTFRVDQCHLRVSECKLQTIVLTICFPIARVCGSDGSTCGLWDDKREVEKLAFCMSGPEYRMKKRSPIYLVE